MGYPSIYPTGTTIYDPSRCFNGYTVIHALDAGALLLDMNGTEAKLWRGLHGMPNKILPGGYVMGYSGMRNPEYGFLEHIDVVQVDWDGNIVWRFDEYEFIEDPGEEPRWMALAHHDFQREGNPVGYYVPGLDPLVDEGNTLILNHKKVKNPDISEKMLLDDSIIEVNWEGEIIWDWVTSEHFNEFDWSEEARNILSRNPNLGPHGDRPTGDWMHLNSISTLGPNRLYESGDKRFHPDNIIWCAREANITAIIDKDSGKIAWSVGPEYNKTKELKELGWIIGQHHAHMIPKGLPGEGNILVFDNGGFAGYGPPSAVSPTGIKSVRRDYSRVLEYDPTNLKIVWEYQYVDQDRPMPVNAYRFYSSFESSAQRLPNGNTLIAESAGGRILEVTKDREIVWEYVNPFWSQFMNMNKIYRAYRLPYEWIPQLDPPKEVEVEPIDIKNFRVPGAASSGIKEETAVEGTLPFPSRPDVCVVKTD
jgi:hypothetical protein